MENKVIINSFDEYTKEAAITATFGDKPLEAKLGYIALGIVGEAGEIAEKMKKVLRGDKPRSETLDNTEWENLMCKEIGDVLW